MQKIILFNATATEKRAAILEDRKLVEIVIERPDRYRILGNIYRGRVSSILPGIQSAFIDVGLEKAAFLHASDVNPSLLLDPDDENIERYTDRSQRSKRRQVARVPIEQVLEKGQDILVQVIREPIGNKSPKVTTQISLAGRFLVLVPDANFIGVSKKSSDYKMRKNLIKVVSQYKPAGVGFIVRTIGLKVSENEMISEMKALVDSWRNAQKEALRGAGPKLIFKERSISTQVMRDLFTEDVSEVYVDDKEDFDDITDYLKRVSPDLCRRVKSYSGEEPLFDKFQIEKELERSLKRKVWMKNGGYLCFDQTEALLAIDVNTGRNVGKKDLEDTIFQTNLASVHEICRQLRLRDLGGLIVVDFIDMYNHQHRKRIEHEMRVALAKDSSATACTGLSKFCLMEITRKRVRPGLQEVFTDVCPSCSGLGRIFSPATVTARIDRWFRRAESSDLLKNLILTVAPSIATYLQKENGRILHEMEKGHGFSIELVVDEELDQDEFEIFKHGETDPITEKYS